MTWHRAKYSTSGRYVNGNYHIQKDHSRLGDVWRVYYNNKEIAQSMTLRGGKAAAAEHFGKAVNTLRNNGL